MGHSEPGFIGVERRSRLGYTANAYASIIISANEKFNA
jgi:hypothetical protein